MNTCKLYSKKIWDKFECSLIITIILCIAIIATNIYLQIYVLESDPNKGNNKINNNSTGNSTVINIVTPTPVYIYVIYSVNCGLLFIHSLDIYTSTTKYKERQRWIIVFSTFIAVVYYIGANGIGSAISIATGSFVRNVFFSYIYLMYTVVIINALTHPIKKWASFFEDKNLIKLIGNNILLGYDDYNNYCCFTNEEFNNFMPIGLHLIIIHSALSMIMLGLSFIFNLQKYPYYIACIISISLTILVATCKLIMNKKQIESINGDSYEDNRLRKKLHKNVKYFFWVLFCECLPYIIFTLVTFFVFLPYNGFKSVKPKNIFFMVQGIIMLSFIACCLIYHLFKLLCGTCEDIKKEVNDEQNEVRYTNMMNETPITGEIE